MAGAADIVINEHVIDVARPASRAEPLTWGQRPIWRAHQQFRLRTSCLDLSHGLTVPGWAAGTSPVSPPPCRRCSVGISCYAPRIQGNGAELRQVPFASGRLSARIVHIGIGFGGRTVREAMTSVPFDYVTEWPSHVSMVVDGDPVSYLALVFSHAAVGLDDRHYLPPEQIELFLRQLEHPAVSAAFHDVRWPWRTEPT